MLLQGRSFFEHGLPADYVRLRIYQCGFGGDDAQLGEEIVTDIDGKYVFSYESVRAASNVEVRAVGGDGRTEVALTEVMCDAGDGEALDLVVPGSLRPLEVEYQRLGVSLGRQLRRGRLGDAREDAVRRDLSLLHCATRWDARLIALAAGAETLSAATGVDRQALYGMLRAGLPSDPVQLARVSRTGVGYALRKAVEGGVVALTSDQVEAALAVFDRFAQVARRSWVAPGGLSSYGEMLAASGLSSDEQDRFDEVFATHRGSAEKLWERTRSAGLPVEGLQLTARLGFLTVNNADLVVRLREEIGSENPVGVLVGGRLYQPDAWVARLKSLAGDEEALARLIPPVCVGESTAERLAVYAADLARKVRRSYPTEVVAHMVSTDQLSLGRDHPAVKTDVSTVLERASAVGGFLLGSTPVNSFLRDHGENLFTGIPAVQVPVVTEHVKTLYRLYQITPTDEALKVLLENGFTSAHELTVLPGEKFARRYGGAFASYEQAELVYRKAQQVSSTIDAIVGAACQMDSPAMYVLSATSAVRTEAKNNLIERFPTLESLFGSLDYCDCDHCRSVLSPAAYLVDLLHYLDIAAGVWGGDMTEWKRKHNEAPYPFADQQAWQKWIAAHLGDLMPDSEITPYQVLEKRRPDLSALPLTCENTNTVMPYIDIVNEILEYYLVHRELTAEAGYDTGTAVTADLVAEPQHVLSKAYDQLKLARYPLTLPFDLGLETVRSFCGHFDTPLWTVLDALRTSDELYPPTGPAYGRAAVFLERLGLSAAEYTLFTDPDPVANWHQLYGYQTAQEAAELSSAKTLARRLGVSYRELIELVSSHFVNPRLETLGTLRKLGISTEDVLRYQGKLFTDEERKAFEGKLAAGGGLAWLQQAWDADDFGRVLVLADSNAGGGFETTTLCYANGKKKADAMAFLTLNYLVRLRRRLGWSIPETDRAVQTFLPRNPDPWTPTNLGPAMATALLGIAHLDALNALLGGGAKGRSRLRFLWSPVDDATYGELFLTGNTQAPDATVFDHPLGRYLCHLDAGQYLPFHWDLAPGQEDEPATGNIGLANHLGAVRAALQLTAEEIAQILLDAGTSLPSAALNRDTVSLLYRYGLLAKLLKLPVADLIILKGLSGLDPFTPLHDGPVTSLEQDHPYGQTLRFVEAAAAVGDSGLSITDLDFLLRHRFDPAGPYRVAAAAPLALVRTLAVEIARIRAEHTVPADPLTFTDDVIRQQLALVLPADTAETFLSMWTGTVEYRASQSVDGTGPLDPTLFATEPAITVSYDPVRAQQQAQQHLVYRGVLTEARRTKLAARFPQPLFTGLLMLVQQQAQDFFVQHLQKVTVGADLVGFLKPEQFDAIFAASPAGLSETAQRARRAALAQAFLPYLRDRLVRQLIAQTVAADLDADPALVEALITDPTLLDDPDHTGRALVDTYAAATEHTVPSTTGLGGGAVQGYLEVPVTGDYRFFAVCGQGVHVELRFDHLTDPLLRGTADTDGAEFSDYTELRAGELYGFTLDATLPAGPVTLLVQGEQLPKGSLERLTLYPREAVLGVQRVHLLLAKTLRLVAALELSEREVRHMLRHRDDFGGLDLGQLPTRTAEDTPDRATALFGQCLHLLDYQRLRRQMAAEPDELVDLFEHARRTYPAAIAQATAEVEVLGDLCARLGRITRRDPATVRAAVDLLGISAHAAQPAGGLLEVAAVDFAREPGLTRLWQVLAMAAALGVTVDALDRWATPTPDQAVAQNLRDTLKARYEPELWRRVAQPLFDRLRRQRRDALVAHIMHTDNFDRVEQLYEHFLIDPGTEPVVQTSRLRLAISSVQLFIQRCLLNLEPEVHPSVLDSDRWQWMKRYRVWEANRKIFLFPENWLEPEWRDDKTHLFTELEGALLQSDLSNEHAETAFFAYLSGLEELARLDIRSIYVEEKPNSAANVLHVVARTFGSPHKYFYRSHADGMWTPWVPVTADIPGDHLSVVVWRGRVHLFWVIFLEKSASQIEGKKTPNQMLDTPLAALRPPRWVEVQLNWTEYVQGEWVNPTSSGFLKRPNAALVGGPPVFDPAAEFIHATIGSDDAVRIHLTEQLGVAIRLVNKNSAPTLEDASSPVPPSYGVTPDGGGRYTGDGGLAVTYSLKVNSTNGKETSYSTPVTRNILGPNGPYLLVTHGDELHGMSADLGRLVSPFFYLDAQHTFYVEPTLTENTIPHTEGFLGATTLQLVDRDSVDHWDTVKVAAHVPVGPAPPRPVSPIAKFTMQPPQDWATDSRTRVQFGDTLIGATGAVTPILSATRESQR